MSSSSVMKQKPKRDSIHVLKFMCSYSLGSLAIAGDRRRSEGWERAELRSGDMVSMGSTDDGNDVVEQTRAGLVEEGEELERIDGAVLTAHEERQR